ncbi:MAG: SDR family NAD(P)-dependent oxidoreductase [Pirellulales bacterium]
MPDVSNALAGRVAVVTGGSRGIGRAIALELAAAGADVLVHAGRARDAASAVAAEIQALGRAAHVEIADLADGSRWQSLVARAWEFRNRVDIWVNNAGVDVLTGAAAGWSYDEKLIALWNVDVAATAGLTRLVGARMKAAGRGVILNMGWDQAATGMEGETGELFALAKGAIMAFTKSAALNLAPQVRVNCLAPGWIKTAWGETASAAWQKRAQREAQLGRWGTPADVARVARWLASDDAAFVTGQIVNVDGGFRPR